MRNKRSSEGLSRLTNRLDSRKHQNEGNQYFTCRPRTERSTTRCCKAWETHGTNRYCDIHLDKTHGTESNQCPFISRFPFRAHRQSSPVQSDLDSASDQIAASLNPVTLLHSIQEARTMARRPGGDDSCVTMLRVESAYFHTPQDSSTAYSRRE